MTAIDLEKYLYTYTIAVIREQMINNYIVNT